MLYICAVNNANVEGAQGGESWPRVFYTNKSYLGRWLGSEQKHLFFFPWIKSFLGEIVIKGSVKWKKRRGVSGTNH